MNEAIGVVEVYGVVFLRIVFAHDVCAEVVILYTVFVNVWVTEFDADIFIVSAGCTQRVVFCQVGQRVGAVLADAYVALVEVADIPFGEGAEVRVVGGIFAHRLFQFIGSELHL